MIVSFADSIFYPYFFADYFSIIVFFVNSVSCNYFSADYFPALAYFENFAITAAVSSISSSSIS
jgi:hypothetical protein